MANIVTGYQINGTDIGNNLTNMVPKDYLIDRYPELVDTFRFAGLWAAGLNSSGQLGDNSVTSSSSPVQTISSGANWKYISAGVNNAAAIKTDGTLWLWGNNTLGKLGNNSNSSVSSPVQTVSGGTNWKQVEVFDSHTAAIKTDGTLWLWGDGTGGKFGNNASTNASSPVQTVSGGTNWKQVSGGLDNTVAIKTNGTLWLWGRNFYGQLGNNDSGDSTANKSSPVQTVSAGTNWKYVSCGETFVTALKTDGTLWTWGRNNNGQLGDNTTTNKSSPIQTVASGTNWKQVSAGGYYVAAIKTDGTLWSWGNNGTVGRLGDGTTTAKSSPVQTVSGGFNWKQVSCAPGLGAQTLAIKTDGTLWLWGANASGQLGTNDTTPQSSPVQTVAGGSNWMNISSGKDHILAIRDNSNDLI